MWQVLRRYQGEEYGPHAATPALSPDTPEGQRAALRQRDRVGVSLRTIAQHECRPHPTPQDPRVLTTPYGDLVYGKLVRSMAAPEVLTRRRALAMLLELYALKAEHVGASLAAGTTAALTARLQDEDDDVRAAACEALGFIAQQPKGQEDILRGGHLAAFLAAVDDPSSAVVAEALRLLCSVHAAHNECACTRGLMALGSIPKYVACASSTDLDVACVAFAALGKVFDVKEAFIEALDTGAMPAITAALDERSDPLLIIEASECAGKLAFYSAGKRAAVRHETCKALAKHLRHLEPAVRTAVSGALVAVTISESGKLLAIDSDVVPQLMDALAAEDERDVLVNQVKILCNLSEHPYARQLLSRVVPRLNELAAVGSGHAPLVESVQRALAMIRWQPGDAY